MSDDVTDIELDDDGEGNPNILPTSFDEALSERYLVYALSTITARSLPDVRDGLKPVHRRLLWAMRGLKLDPKSGYKKCARVVGDVVGKYHPHGDQAVYDAMVRLAQDFALRYPLVDGQGNFGNIDGDNAAAYRYTEARLTQTAIELMDGLNEGTVNFLPTYNGEDEEPEILPGLFPNLLANGAAGIAVGMATSIPSHNVAEIIDAALLVVDDKNVSHESLMDVFHGPDFATGGILPDNKEIISEAYRTGRGSFRLRARWEKEDMGRGQWQIVITEIPYQVQKGKLIEQIANLVLDKKLPILADVRDESDEQIRIVLEPRSRTVEPEILMDSLFRMTDLETRFSLNMNVLDAIRAPSVMGLKEILQHWLAHQFIVLQRKSQHRLDNINNRLELLGGYIIAFLNLDRVIEIIRNEDEPKPIMMAEFSLTDRQAEAILNMRLRSLRKLEEMELKRERDALEKEREDLQKLLDSEARQRTRMKRDLAEMRKAYAEDTVLGKRRTLLEEAGAAREIPLEAMIEKEPATVILSTRGWIKAMKGHADLARDDLTKFKEGDGPAFALHAQTTDRLILITDDGRFYSLGVDKLPGARGFGEPVRSMLDIDNDANIMSVLVFVPDNKFLVVADNGRGFQLAAEDVMSETRKGKQIVNLKGDARLKVARIMPDNADHVAAIGDNRKLVIFALADLPQMARGQGVQLQRYRDGGLSDAIAFCFADGLSWTMGGETGRRRTETDIGLWKVARGAAGRLPPNGFPRSNRFDD